MLPSGGTLMPQHDAPIKGQALVTKLHDFDAKAAQVRLLRRDYQRAQQDAASLASQLQTAEQEFEDYCRKAIA